MFEIANRYYLPKPYLSYSAINSFLSNRNDFRRKYYEGYELPNTPELIFGKQIGERLENNDTSLQHILRYDTPEYKLEFEVDHIPVLGYIDTFDTRLNKIGEYKTGKTPWTQGRVDKHLQLDIYSLGVEMTLGKVDDECILVWMETERIDRPLNGRGTHGNQYDIQLTGKVKEFVRTINAQQRKDAYDTIVRVAQDISEDYTDWLSHKEQSQSSVRGGRTPYAQSSLR